MMKSQRQVNHLRRKYDPGKTISAALAKKQAKGADNVVDVSSLSMPPTKVFATGAGKKKAETKVDPAQKLMTQWCKAAVVISPTPFKAAVPEAGRTSSSPTCNDADKISRSDNAAKIRLSRRPAEEVDAHTEFLMKLSALEAQREAKRRRMEDLFEVKQVTEMEMRDTSEQLSLLDNEIERLESARDFD